MDQQTLNDSGINQEVGGIVSPDGPKFDPDSTNVFRDIDDEPGASSAADDKQADDGDGKAGDTGKKGQEGRYDKDPDWQRMRQERDEARKEAEAVRLEKARLEGRLEAAPEKKVVPESLPFKDISTLTAEQIREWQEDDPKGFAENLKLAAIHEATRTLREEYQAQQARDREQGSLQKTYVKFEEKNPDFTEKWNSGEIVKFIEANPGHNPISAYYELTHEARLAAAVAEATKKAEEEVTKRFQAKKKATVLTGGASSMVRTDDDPALSNTKAHGGLNAVLADKLAQMRRASGR